MKNPLAKFRDSLMLTNQEIAEITRKPHATIMKHVLESYAGSRAMQNTLGILRSKLREAIIRGAIVVAGADYREIWPDLLKLRRVDVIDIAVSATNPIYADDLSTEVARTLRILSRKAKK